MFQITVTSTVTVRSRHYCRQLQQQKQQQQQQQITPAKIIKKGYRPFSRSLPLSFSSFFYSFKVVSPPLNEVLLTRKGKASSSVNY